jgi:hypothetical protein
VRDGRSSATEHRHSADHCEVTPDDASLLEQHIDVLFDTDNGGRLLRVNEPDPEAPPPRLFVARGRSAVLAWCRSDVSDAVASAIAAGAVRLPVWNGGDPDPDVYDDLCGVLDGAGPIGSISHGPAFRFPGELARPPHAGDAASSDHPSAIGDAVLIDEASADLLDRFFPYTRSVLAARQPVAAVVRDGSVVSACYSARRRATAAEAGVDTIELYRGAGFAVAVVEAWAGAVESAGMTPLYSTSWDNAASLRVAAKLRLIPYADTFSAT